MDLKEFVKETLAEIVEAVDESSKDASREIYLRNTGDTRTIEFDIAVSAESTDAKNGKAGIRVLQFAEAGGDISKETKNSTVSRIKFGVNVSTSTKAEDARSMASYNREMEKYNNATDPY